MLYKKSGENAHLTGFYKPQHIMTDIKKRHNKLISPTLSPKESTNAKKAGLGGREA